VAHANVAQLRTKVGANWQNVPGATVSLAQAAAFEGLIALHYPTHRDVLTHNAQWRAIYNVANRVLSYVDRANAPAPHAAEETVPCHDCNLVCRLDANITIDHQRPQAGNEMEPVCKVFRAMGLTLDGPSGRKGLNVVGAWRASVGGLANAGVGTLNAKYTLNNIREDLLQPPIFLKIGSAACTFISVDGTEVRTHCRRPLPTRRVPLVVKQCKAG
jgi:hypothetical protein